MKMDTWVWMVALVGLVGCDDVGEEDNTLVGPRADVTFYEDVAPIFAQACNGCHAQGGIAPFALDEYEQARALGPVIASTTHERTMPPWNVVSDGSCNEFEDARWLSEQDIATIGEWVDSGMEAGDAELGVPLPPPQPTLGTGRVVSLSTPVGYTPVAEGISAAMYDDYQCFLVDPQLDEDAMLVGFDVDPGDATVVHHVLAFNIEPGRLSLAGSPNADVMDALEAQDADLGWDCYGAAGEDVWVEGVPVTWAPGTGATQFPAGTGIRIKAGQKIVVQVHYNLVGPVGVVDPSTVHLEFADKVEREAHLALVDGLLLTILGTPAQLPPGVPDARFSYDMALGEIPNMNVDFEKVDVWGVLPHMHQRGRKMKIDFEVDGHTQCGANVEHWDFEWQQSYFYKQPIPMTMDDKVSVMCEYDTMGDEAPVLPGLGTGDEMCLVGVYVAERG